MTNRNILHQPTNKVLSPGNLGPRLIVQFTVNVDSFISEMIGYIVAGQTVAETVLVVMDTYTLRGFIQITCKGIKPNMIRFY